MALKAYTVQEPFEMMGGVVFAESPSKAKALMHGHDFICDCEYTSLICRRAPKADGYAHLAKHGILDFEPETEKVYWELGWWYEDGDEHCSTCGRYWWPNVSESELVYDDTDDLYNCKSCLGISSTAPACEEADTSADPQD